MIESAVDNSRGLPADSWVSAGKLSSGATNVWWFALISSRNPVQNTKPSKPTLSVDAGTAESKTYFKWNCCSNTTHYDLRVYTGNDSIVYAIGNCSDADVFDTHMMYTDTSHAKALGEGSYYTRVAAVNNETGEYTFSDFVEFTVKPSSKKDITVTFVTATGNTSTYPKNVVSTGNKYGELPVPKKETGRTFLNWKTADNIIITADTIVTESKDHYLYANYDYDTWIMYFDAQGGTASFDNKIVTYTKKYGELPTAIREGYTFEGWKLFYTQSKYLTPDDDVYYINYDTAYAYWTPNEYIVTFNTSGGNVSSTSKSVKYNTNYGTLPIPTKSGYEFLGWFDPESGVYITEETTLNISKNHTVYAHWQKEGFTGDVNNDGIVSVADAIMLQKWLLGSRYITNWKNADICKDNKLDVFDMIEMRKLLISQFNEYTEWSTDVPPYDAVNIESRTEYRYAKKSYKTSETQLSSPWVMEDTKTEYGEWGNWSDYSEAKVESTDNRKVETKIEQRQSLSGYNMFYYCTRANDTKIRWYRDYSIADSMSAYDADIVYGEHSSILYNENLVASQAEIDAASVIAPGEWFEGTANNGVNKGNTNGYYLAKDSTHMWYKGDAVYNNYDVTLYRYCERTKKNVYTYSQTGKYSEWSTTPVESSDDVIVETRTVYRYIPAN